MKLIIDYAIGFLDVSGNNRTDATADTAGTDETVQPNFASGSLTNISVSGLIRGVIKIAEDGTVLKQKDLISIFCTLPGEFSAFGSKDALLCNLAQDFSQREGATIDSDLRNLLGDVHDADDLAAIDILQERDLGIATLNPPAPVIAGATPYEAQK